MEKTMKDLTKKLSWKEIFSLWMPLVISGLFGQCYGIINTVTVSKFINSDAIAVMGACRPYKSLQGYIFSGVTTGLGLVVCRRLREKDWKIFKSTLNKTVFISGCLAALAFLCIPLTSVLMDLINVPLDLQEAGYTYLLFVFLGSCALTGKNLLVTILNGMAKMKLISVVSVAGLILETLLVVLLVGVFKTNVWGASCAIFITDTIIFLILLFFFIKYYNAYKLICYKNELDIKTEENINNETTIKEPDAKEIIFSGCAKPIMMALVAVGSMFVQSAVNQISNEIIAGMSYADTITVFFMDPLCSLALLAASLFSQSAPKINDDGCRDNLKANRKKLIILLYIWSAISLIFVFAISPEMIRFLAEKDVSADIIDVGKKYLMISLWGFPGLAYYLINRAGLHAIGENKYLPLFGFIEMSVSIIFAVLLFPIYGFGVFPIEVLIKWIVPGIVSEVIVRRKNF